MKVKGRKGEGCTRCAIGGRARHGSAPNRERPLKKHFGGEVTTMHNRKHVCAGNTQEVHKRSKWQRQQRLRSGVCHMTAHSPQPLTPTPEVTVHSRAARRAASPSIDLDKKLKTTTRDSASPSRPSQAKPHALAAQNAGIQKKNKKSNMTRAQRMRHEKGLERAAAVLDKREVKVVKSIGKEKVVKERAKGWEDVNEEGKKKKKKTIVEEEAELAKRREREWVSDEEMDETAPVDAGEGEGEGKQVDVALPESVPLPVEEDELL